MRGVPLRWLSTRLIVALVGAALAAALAGLGLWWWLDAQEREAVAAYLAAMKNLPADGAPAPEARAAAARELEAALARYPSSSLAPLAAYELGNLRYAERDWTRARAAWEMAAARTGSPTVRILARAGIGYTWEAERNYERAAAAFQAALEGVGPGDFQYADLLLDVARTQELAGKKDAAVETYRRLLKEVPQSPRAEEVRVRLARLGAGP
jgi:tetratricopeptide (TPR) repeat protein